MSIWSPHTKSTSPVFLVTREGLDEAISRVSTAEAKAIKYLITRGIEVSPLEGGEMGFCAKDVAICFGYVNPDKAIRKYCKSVVTGYITAADVNRLARHSKLTNAINIRLWIARADFR